MEGWIRELLNPDRVGPECRGTSARGLRYLGHRTAYTNPTRCGTSQTSVGFCHTPPIYAQLATLEHMCECRTRQSLPTQTRGHFLNFSLVVRPSSHDLCGIQAPVVTPSFVSSRFRSPGKQKMLAMSLLAVGHYVPAVLACP